MNQYVGIAWNIVNIMALLMILTFYTYFNIKLLVRMFIGHRLEFEGHSRKHIANVVTTALCILIFLYQDFIWLLNYSCEAATTDQQYKKSFCEKL